MRLCTYWLFPLYILHFANRSRATLQKQTSGNQVKIAVSAVIYLNEKCTLS